MERIVVQTEITERLRSLHLDELPQVVNILGDETSPVGPRPRPGAS